LRIGFGQYDRCFNKDSSFYLGGILFSTSDEHKPTDPNDVLIQSIADAMLGASGLGGLYNYQEQNKINNPEILREIERDIHYRGWVIENIDITIAAPDQMIVDKQSEMHSHLISWLFLKSEQLNIKFTYNTEFEKAEGNKIKITTVALLTDRS
jgi:2-C-methyl-D-erythritol 2,4-cyclodiphosphate synthase